MKSGTPASKLTGIRPPPVLLLATLLFWGQQSDFVTFGAVMGVILESARLIKVRLDLLEDDFRRIWNFCMLLALALALYAFSTDKEGGGMGSLFHASSDTAGRTATATVDTATALFQWLPMTFFLLVAAQVFCERQTVPLSAISFFFRRRRQRDGGATPERLVDVTYPYFMVCLGSAGVHINEGVNTYFWGLCLLIPWALWPMRSRRFGLGVWLGICALVIACGFGAQFGISQSARLLENYNAQWMARWLGHSRTDPSQAYTAIGQIGRLKLSSQIVIWLTPANGGAPPAYLREASYRYYRSEKEVWNSGGGGRRNGGVPNDFDPVAQDVRGGDTWLLLRDKAHTSTVNIACYLDGRAADTGNAEGLLPLPSGCSRLDNLPLISLDKNKTGAVMASSSSRLTIFDAVYGPGATIDSPPDTNLDFRVPYDEAPALDQVIREMKLTSTSEDRELLAVQNFFADNFTYSTWQKMDKRPTTNETALTKFLLHSRSGHCEYFATATVLLLRELHIPARYAVGYAVHEPMGSGYVVRDRDAHAWCLVWDNQAGVWKDFDTTPASWVEAEGGDGGNWFSDFWSWVGFEFAKAKLRISEGDYHDYLLWALFPLMALLLGQIIFRRRKRLRGGQSRREEEHFFWPGLDSEFYQLEKKLAEQGVRRQPGELLSNWLERTLTAPNLADLREPLRQLLQLHYRHRFDPRGLSAEEREQLRRKVKACLDALLQVKN